MPNHVANVFTITGPEDQLGNLFANHVRPDGTQDSMGLLHLDFQTIVPMPECLQGIDASSSVEMWCAALGAEDIPNRKPARYRDALTVSYWVNMAADEGIVDRATLLEACKRKHSDAEFQARRAIEAIKQTGYSNWYQWAPENWGTKWNSYSFEMLQQDADILRFRFDTAWSPPEPVMLALAAMYPDIVIDGYAFDDGWNFAAECHFENGDGYYDSFTPDLDVPADRGRLQGVYDECYGAGAFEAYLEERREWCEDE